MLVVVQIVGGERVSKMVLVVGKQEVGQPGPGDDYLGGVIPVAK